MSNKQQLKYNDDELNKLMKEAMDYYVGIPSYVWEIPEIKRRVFSGNALVNCPKNGLLGMTVCGHEFKYIGIPFEYALETLATHKN